MADDYGITGEIVGADAGTPPEPGAPAAYAALPSLALYWPFEQRPLYITQHFRPASKHYGLDVGIPTGVSYYSPLPARSQVVWAGWDSSGYGIGVGLKTDELGAYIIIGHMQRVNPDLRAGVWVDPWGYLGTSDSTGNSTGPHMHLEVRRGPGWYPYPSSCVDPYPLLRWRATQPAPPTPPPSNEWYRMRTTRQISCYSAPNINTALPWPKLAGGMVFTVRDAKASGGRAWVQLENGLYVMRQNKGKTLMVRV